MKNKHTKLLAGLIAATSLSAYAGDSASCKANYEKQRSVRVSKYDQSEKAFGAKYLTALEHMQSKYQAAANLDAVVAIKVRDEIQRLKTDPAVLLAQRVLAVDAATQAKQQRTLPVSTRAIKAQPVFASPGNDKGKDGKDQTKTGGSNKRTE